MSGDTPRAPVPEEQAALAELERLQRAIEESRKRRLAANDAYDSFMDSLDAPPPPRVERAVVPPPAPVVPPVPQVKAPVARPPEPFAPAWRPPSGGSTVPPTVQPNAADPLAAITPEDDAGLDEFPNEVIAPGEIPRRRPPVEDHVEMAWGALDGPAPSAQPPSIPAALTPTPARTGGSRTGLMAIGVVALLVAGVVAWRVLPSASPETAESTAAAAAATSPQPAPPASSPPPAEAPAPAVQPKTPKAELTTLRRVWVRVLVDGERAVERELDADVRLPFDPRQQIVVRAGDAGAVRVSIDGKDQGTLGRDGFPVTRTFPVPPSPAR